jgi:hypothetical protein
MRTLVLGAVVALLFVPQATAFTVTKPATKPIQSLIQKKPTGESCFSRCMANRCKNAQSRPTCCARICRGS